MFESMALRGRPLPRYIKALVADLPFGPGATLTAGVRTTHTLTTAPCNFSAVALLLVNIGPALVIDAAAVAVTESSVNKLVPVVDGVAYNAVAAADTNRGWVPVTFAGATSFTMPVGTQTAPWFGLSDFVPLTSIPRVDGGKYPLIMRREYYNNRAHLVKQSNSPANAEALGNRFRDFGREYYNALSPGDGCTDPASFSGTWAPGAVNNNLWVAGYVFRSIEGGHTVVLAGDSIMQAGSQTSTPQQVANSIIGSWASQAVLAEAEKAPLPVGLVNVALAGATPTEYLARFKSVLNAGVPCTVGVYPPWSPNTFPPSGRIKEGTFLGLASDFIESCRQVQATPVLAHPTPYNVGYQETRKRVKANIKKMPAPSIDFLSSGAENEDGTYKEGMFADSIHPSEQGHAALARSARDVLGVVL